MSLATFRINQPPSTPYANWDRARHDIDLYSVGSERVELEAQNASELSYLWEMVSAPYGVTVTISGATANKCDFEINDRGPYIGRLTINAGEIDEDIKLIYFSVDSEGGVHAFPAFNETNEDNAQSPYTGERGTEIKANAFRNSVDRHVWMPAKTENATRTLAASESGYTHLENGAGVVLTLPVATRGLRFAFETDANNMTIDCQGSDEFRGDMVSHFGTTWTSIDLVAGRSRVYASAILDGGNYHWRLYSEAGSLFKTGDATKQWLGAVAINDFAWNDGAGTGALKRTVDIAGLADGDYSVNAGIGGNAEAVYSFIGNRDNVVNSGSPFSAIFGYDSEIGATYASPYSFVAGGNNVIDGDAVNEYGFNCVVGNACNVDGDYNAVFGNTHTVASDYSHVVGDSHNVESDFCSVSGYSHLVGTILVEAPHSVVGGQDHSVDGWENKGNPYGANAVFGFGHTVATAYSIVAGFSNTITDTADGSNSNAVFGQVNSVGATYQSSGCIVAGEQNIVNGDYHAVFNSSNEVDGGYYNTVIGNYNVATGVNGCLVSGNNNDVDSSNYCIVGGAVNAVGAVTGSPRSLIVAYQSDVDGKSGQAHGANCVTGRSHDVDADYSAVFGYLNTVVDEFNVVGGSTNTVNYGRNAVFGSGNIVGAARFTGYSLVVGSGNSVDGNVSSALGDNIVAGQSQDVDANHCAVFGFNHTVSDDHNIVAGDTNIVTSDLNGVFGKSNNVSDGSNLVAGQSNDVDGFAVIVAGSGHYIDQWADYSATFGVSHENRGHYSLMSGQSNVVGTSGDHSAVSGYKNEANEGYSHVSGYGCVSRWHSQVVHSGFTPDTDFPGESQNTVNLSASCEAVGAVPAWTQLYPDGHAGSKVLTLVVDTSYYYHYMVVARKKGQLAAEMTKSWHGEFLAQRDNAASSLVGSPTVTSDFATSNGDEASWDFQITTTIGNAIKFEAKGSADAADPTHFQLYVYGPEVCTAH